MKNNTTIYIVRNIDTGQEYECASYKKAKEKSQELYNENEDRKIIFKCRTGSHLYGLNRETSDEDFLSVFIPSSKDLLGLQKCEIINNSTKSSSESRRNDESDVDDTSYSLPKFLHLLLQNNPNILESLFVSKENILICEPEFQYLIDNYDKIVSLKVQHTFSGYAYSQKQKLVTKKERYLSLSEGLKYLENIAKKENKDLDTLLENQLFWRNITEKESIDLNNLLKYYKGSKFNTESFHKGMDIGMIYCRIRQEYEQYGWRVKTKEFETLHMDCKFAYHLIRLMLEGIELLETGKLFYPISGNNKKQLMDIRDGLVSYDELLLMFNDYDTIFKERVSTSKLRHSSDFNWANDWLIKTLKECIIKEEE